MDEERSIRCVNHVDTIDCRNSSDDFFVVLFGIAVDRDVSDEEILTDGNYVDRTDVATDLADHRGYLSELSWAVLNFDPDGETVACVGSWGWDW